MRYTLGTGEEVDVVDKTRPKANKDYTCVWSSDKPHVIPKGDTYVRVVYKLNGKFESDHICLDCWCGVMGEDNGAS
jgi:hypothetical protein